ncbi:MAG: aminotransferase class III-fold pyridoxal phosphate-dependent enzyme [Pirellulales bacterium]
MRRIPAGTQCYSKGPTAYAQGVAPIYLQRGHGCRVWDVDGNEFVDLGMGLWAVTLGHNYPPHVAALTSALQHGTQFTLMHPLEVELAEQLAATIPIAEMVRYGKNGSDVTTAAVRLARACTGREVVIRCGYHGWHDWYLASTEWNRGVPEFNRAISGCFDENDRVTFDRLMDQFEGKVAAVIMEGVQSRDVDKEFLQHVRARTRKDGALLIFDEIVNGFRFAVGGAHEWLGIDVDLVTFGKGMGNGTPISALAGKREFMKELDTTFFSFTFGGEALGLAAALEVLQVYRRESVIDQLWQVGRRLHDATEKAIAAAGLDSLVELTPHPVRTLWVFREPYRGCDGNLLKSLFQQEVLRRGVLWAGWHALSLSLAQDEQAIERIITAYQRSLAVVARAVETESVRHQLQGKPVKPVFRRH